MKSNILFWSGLCLLIFALASCSGSSTAENQFKFTFEEGQVGWETGFTDLPIDYDPEFYELDSGWSELPSGLGGNAIFLSGHNHSDDLFMFLKTQIDGLKPDTTYQVNFSIDLASNTPEGMMGIGGSPGESVYLKAGAVDYEPEVIEASDGHLRMNIDKGNQASEGQDMINLGTLANPNIDLDTFTGEEYALMTLNNQDQVFSVTTDSNGNVWVIAGTDSGFEGPTTVYYDAIKIIFTGE
jgi:hypothetical protein